MFDVDQERPLSAEELRARAEDPEFARTLARAKARARGVPYVEGEELASASRRTDRGLLPFAQLVARACRVDPEHVVAAAERRERIETHGVTRRQSAGAWRISEYIPQRHRDVVLHLCPRPVDPTDALPSGQCKCLTGRHYVPQNESQRLAFRTVVRWMEAVERGDGPALILVGPTGVGKSHLLWAACRMLNEAEINAAGTSWKKLSDTIRDAKSHPDPELRMDAAYRRDRFTNATALHLDEVRATAGTDFDPMELSLLVTERYDQGQALLMTSQQRGQALTALADSASTGRLHVQEMVGANYRKPNELPSQLRALG